MKQLITSTLAFTILSSLSTIASASFEIKIPLESSLGGPLSNGSISMGVNPDGTNGSNGNGNGTDNGSTDPTTPTEPTETTEPTDPETPTEPVVQCSNNASQIGQVLLSSGYSDIYVASYAYRMSFTETGGEKERCTVTLNIPNSKMSPCVSNNSYRTSAVSYLEANFDVMQPIETTWRYSYSGSCSN
ncbi:hypothetical protein ACNE9Y_30105 [Pseudomonas sp. NY11226]|uniref:hypothetical protein n=1 Tax=unclassified Pseudomonas TaxID=196821 RepID=UPI0031F631A4